MKNKILVIGEGEQERKLRAKLFEGLSFHVLSERIKTTKRHRAVITREPQSAESKEYYIKKAEDKRKRKAQRNVETKD